MSKLCKSDPIKYWLMKSEPETYSIDDLEKNPKQTTSWDGVRNYQARNFMRDDMKKGDLVFFYHSSCKIPGIVGIAEVVKEAYPEIDNWVMVDIKFKQKFNQIITIKQLREIKSLNDMKILQKGNRLSITPVSKKHWDIILKLINKN